MYGLSLSSCPQHSLKVLLLLNLMCHLKYILNCEQNFSYFDLDYLTAWLPVTRLSRIYCISNSMPVSETCFYLCSLKPDQIKIKQKGYLLTELSTFWEAANCAAIQEIPSNFKEPEGSSPCLQEPSTGPYPEPVRSSLYHPIPSYLPKIHFNIVHPPTCWSS
jgi:hypothetical protein